MFSDMAVETMRSLRASYALEKHLKINEISRVPPEMSFSGLFGSSMDSRSSLLSRNAL